jgi:hypothetical protein
MTFPRFAHDTMPIATRRDGRYLAVTWRADPAEPPRADGLLRCVKLTVTHLRSAQQYRAMLQGVWTNGTATTPETQVERWCQSEVVATKPVRRSTERSFDAFIEQARAVVVGGSYLGSEVAV